MVCAVLRVRWFGQNGISLVATQPFALGVGLAVGRLLSSENACLDFGNDDEIFKQTTLDSALDGGLFMYVTSQ